MAFRALVSIGDYDFPEPSEYQTNTATIVDSGRNTSGYVVGAVIRNDVSKVTITWNYLTAEKWAEILSCFSPSRGGAFYNDVTFYSQDTASWITRKMYVSDRSTQMWRRDPDNGDILGWVKPSLSLVEV